MLGRRRRREYQTLLAMIEIYCQSKHTPGQDKIKDICADCQELRDYAAERLARCIFAEEKPTCGKCPVHCYKQDMRLRITEVMRFAGPKMPLRHPYWALRHLLDGFARKPKMPKRWPRGQNQ